MLSDFPRLAGYSHRLWLGNHFLEKVHDFVAFHCPYYNSLLTSDNVQLLRLERLRINVHKIIIRKSLVIFDMFFWQEAIVCIFKGEFEYINSMHVFVPRVHCILEESIFCEVDDHPFEILFCFIFPF